MRRIIATHEDAQDGQIVAPYFQGKTWKELRAILDSILDDEMRINSMTIDGHDPSFSVGIDDEQRRITPEWHAAPVDIQSGYPSVGASPPKGQPVEVVNQRQCALRGGPKHPSQRCSESCYITFKPDPKHPGRLPERQK